VNLSRGPTFELEALEARLLLSASPADPALLASAASSISSFIEQGPLQANPTGDSLDYAPPGLALFAGLASQSDDLFSGNSRISATSAIPAGTGPKELAFPAGTFHSALAGAASGLAVTSQQLNTGGNPRSRVSSITLTFSQDVGASLSASDLIVRNLSEKTDVTPAKLSLSYDAATHRATWTFPGLPGNALSSGNYLLQINPSSVTDASGNGLAAPYVSEFFVLPGDSTADRAVNDLDLYQVWQNQLKPAASRNPNDDLNGDGQINASDWQIVENNYRTTLPPPVFQIVETSPSSGALDIGSTVRPQVFFSRPVDGATLTDANFFASLSGQKVPATIVPADNGTFAWLFFKNPMPSAAQIDVTVDGTSIRSAGTNELLDADGDGRAGGVTHFTFTTVSLTPVAGTSLTGIVLDPGPDGKPRTADDVQPGPDSRFGTTDDEALHPLAGVQVYLLGRENQIVTTDASGKFHFDSVPVGNVKVAINGRSALAVPAGIYYPELVMDATMTVGQENFVMSDVPEVYLPPLAATILQQVNSNADTTIVAKPAGASGLTDEQRQRLSIDVQPNSLVAADGTHASTAQVGISTVAPELVRDMLPPGVLQHTFDITVQAIGITNFSTPAPMTFPNVFNAPPGSQLDFLSFDHTTGRLVIEGTATVSADGLSVRTDPGTGVTHPGWHGLTPPGTQTRSPCDPTAPRTIKVDPVPRVSGVAHEFFYDDNGSFTWTFRNDAKPVNPNSDPCSPENVQATPMIVNITVTGPADEFLQGLHSQTMVLMPQQEQSIQATVRRLLTPDKIHPARENILYGAKAHILITKDDGTELDRHDIDVYRFFDIADDVHNDANIDFEKTQLTIAGQTEFQEKHLFLNMPGDIIPRFTAASGRHFSFDPSNDHFRFAPVGTPGIDVDRFTLISPDGAVGLLSTRGPAVGPQLVLFSKTSFTNAIKSVVDQTPADLDLLYFDVLFPAAPAGGKRSDAAGFQDLVNNLYTQTVDKIKGIFRAVDPLTSNALQILDSTAGTGDLITFTNARTGSTVSLASAARNLSATGATVDLNGKTGAIIITNFGVVGADAHVTLNYQTSADGTTWTNVGTANVDSTFSNRVLFPTFDDKVLKRYVRVTTTHTGADSATFSSTVVALDDPCARTAPACAVWADFNREVFIHKDVIDSITGLTSLPEDKFRFDRNTNRSPNDLGQDGTSLAVKENIDLLTGYAYLQGAGLGAFTTLLANAITHEVAHDLGAIHFRDRAHDYVDGNIMGNDGSSSSAPGSFGNVFGPVIRFALGLPVDLDKFPPTFAHYMAYELYERYNHNNNLPSPNDSADDLTFELPFLVAFDGPIAKGSPFPNVVEKIAFPKTVADGTGGQSSSFKVYLFNDGGADLNLSQIRLLKEGVGFTIEGVTKLPIVLPKFDPASGNPEASTFVITVGFDPTKLGAANDTLHIESNSLDGAPLDIPLSALGISPFGDISLVVPNNNFGGTKLSQTVSVDGFATIQNIGASPLSITGILSSPEYSVSGLPANLSAAAPLIIPPDGSFALNISFQAAKTGLRPGEIQITSTDPDTPIFHLHLVGAGLPETGTALDYGNDFVAVETPNQTNAPVLRQKSDDKGNWTFFLPAEQVMNDVIFDPISGLVAHGTQLTAKSGAETSMSAPVFEASTARDTDGDGLPDDAEFAIGTSITKPDTDGDGIDDFTAIQQGLDPLGGRAFPTGVIASLPLRGEADEIVVAGSTVKPTDQTAYIATGSYGLAIVDVSDFQKPILLSEFSLPGNATDVAIDSSLNIAVVADNQGGLAVIDVSNPAAPKLVRMIGLASANQVELVDGFAYVTVGGSLQKYDPLSGEQIQTINLTSGTLTGLARDGNLLFTMDSSNVLRAIDTANSIMVARGDLTMPQGGGKLFVGNGVAYVAARDNFRGGFATADVADPNQLKLLGESAVADTTSAPGTYLAANGSGIGLLLGTPNRTAVLVHAIDLMNLADPAKTNDFITRINLPEDPSSVSIASGIAFVADGRGGLQVVNYLAFDSGDRAPLIQLQPGVVDQDPSTAGIQVVEGSNVFLPLTVSDDVQVRNLELLVNGLEVQNAVSFPYNLSLIAPRISADRSQLVIQVRATDTGGNFTLSDPIVANLVRDTIPPKILSQNPSDGAARGPNFRAVEITFSKPMDAATLNAQTVRVLDAAGNALPAVQFQLRNNGQSLQVSYDGLALGSYRLVINAAAITDRAGNVLGTTALTTGFTIVKGTITWINDTGGAWDAPANWDKGVLPGPTDDVFIGVNSTSVITITGGSILINGLRSENPIDFSGGTLSITTQADLNAPFKLSGGTLEGEGTVNFNQALDWTGGNISGTGLRNIAPGAVLSLTGSNNKFLSDGTVNNAGRALWQGSGNLFLQSGASFVNSATFSAENDGVIAYNGGAMPTFTNTGTFTKTSGANATRFDILLNNNGSLISNSGTIQLNGGGTSSGLFNPTTGVIIFSGGTQTLLNARIEGNGFARLTGGNLTMNGNVSAENVAVDGGALNGAGALTVTKALDWTGGSIEGTGPKNVAAGATLNIRANNKFLDATTLTNNGNAVFSDTGNLYLQSGASFVNAGTFDIRNAAVVAYNGGAAPSFVNTGTIVKSAGAGASRFDVALNNNGTLNVTAGVVQINAGGASAGVFNPTTGSLLFSSGVSTLAAGASVTGAGLTRLNGGTLSIPGNVAFQNFTLEGGTLDVDGTLTINGTFNWTGATLSGSGETKISATATLNLSGNGNRFLDKVTLTNAGSVIWTGTGNFYLQTGATFANAGTFDMRNDAILAYNGGAAPVFVNTGTMVKSAGTGTSRFDIALTNNGTLNVAAGIVQINAGGASAGVFNPTTGSLLFSSGASTLAAGASVTGPGLTRLNGGTLSIPGNVSLQNFTLEGGALDVDGTLTINGTFNWTGATLTGSGETKISATATLNLSGNGNRFLDKVTLTNAGSVIWTGTGNFYLQTGATFANAGTFDMRNDAIVAYNGGAAPTFVNTGTIVKSAGAGTSRFDIALNNNGTLNVTSGIVQINAGGTSAGVFNATTGSLLFSNAITTFAAGATVTGTGLIRLNGGTLSIPANVAFQNFTLEGGTLDVDGTLTVNGTFNWTGATLTGSGETKISATATLNLSGNGNRFLDKATLTNAGTIIWTGTGNFYLQTGATFANAGAFDMRSDASVVYNGGAPPTFVNTGTIVKSAGVGTSRFDIALNNNGTLNVTSGIVQMNAGGTSAGVFNATTGSLLFSNAITTFAAGATVPGTGLVRLIGGTLSIPENLSLQNFTFEGGTLDVDGTLTINGTFNWTGATLTGSGETKISPTATLNLSGGSNRFLDKATLTNAGSVIWTGTGNLYLQTGATFANAGAFDIRNDAVVANNGGTAPTFVNTGTIVKSAGAGTSRFDINVTNRGIIESKTGTTNFNATFTQLDGTTRLAGGNLAGNSLLFQGGLLTGAGTITGNVTNAAVVSPGGPGAAGTLQITGTYQQTAAGILNLDLGGKTSGLFDSITITGTATLNGTLNVSAINGYQPASGDALKILGFASKTGDFTAKNGLTIGGISLNPVYTSTSLTLQAP